MDSLDAAVIGLGSMGANHARVLSDLPGVHLAAVCDADACRPEKYLPAYFDLMLSGLRVQPQAGA